jgi:hypothetical protein
VLVVLSESKLDAVSHYDVVNIFGPRFDGFAYLPALGTCGGIVVVWQTARISAAFHSSTANTISLDIAPAVGELWRFTTVYGPSVDSGKEAFLDEICGIGAACPGRWAIAGDFNLILDAWDKNHGSINCRLVGAFHRTVNDLLLKEAPLVGRSFTWSNERAEPTLA